MLFKKRKANQSEARGRQRVESLPARDKVFSYRANRSENTETVNRSMENLQAQRRGPRWPRFLRKTRNVIVLALLLVFLVLCLKLTGNVIITPTGKEDGRIFLRQQSVYRDAAQDLFASPLNKNKVTVNTNGITKAMKEQFPELRTVTVALPFFGSSPVMYIQPATPRIILVAQKGLFVLDSHGRALINGNEVHRLQDLKIPVVNDQSGLSITVGKVALPGSAVAFISSVAGQLQAQKLTVSSLMLPPASEELDAKLQGSEYIVKFNVRGDAREQAGALLAVKGLLDSQHKKPAQYIDVRVPGRAYYK